MADIEKTSFAIEQTIDKLLDSISGIKQECKHKHAAHSLNLLDISVYPLLTELHRNLKVNYKII